MKPEANSSPRAVNGIHPEFFSDRYFMYTLSQPDSIPVFVHGSANALLLSDSSALFKKTAQVFG